MCDGTGNKEISIKITKKLKHYFSQNLSLFSCKNKTSQIAKCFKKHYNIFLPKKSLLSKNAIIKQQKWKHVLLLHKKVFF